MKGSKIANQFPKDAVCGCYIIRDGETVLYVGQSKRQLRTRWLDHHIKGFVECNFPNASVEVVLCEQSDLLEKEKELIDALSPIMNNRTSTEICKLMGISQNWYEKQPWYAEYVQQEIEKATNVKQ